MAVRLGPSLLGLRVFAGLDLLTVNYPWTDGAVSSVVDNPLIGDTVDWLIPNLIAIHQRLLDGSVPLWLGDAAPGGPGLSAAWLGWATPLTVWSVLLPTAWALGFVKLLQLATALVFTVLWLRRIGVVTAPAAVAGLAYCGSGFFVAWSDWLPQTTAAALLPVLFWATERLAQERTVRAALALAAAVAFLVLAGFPAVAGHGLYAAGCYFLVRLLADRTGPVRRRLRAVGLAVGAVVLGLAASAFQVLPLLGLLGQSRLDYRENQFHDVLPWRSFLSTVLPTTFNPDGYPDSNPIESYAFLGAPVVVLAVVAVGCARMAGVRRGVVTYLGTGTVVAAALAWFQGWWTDWLAAVPVLSGNAPGRLRDLVALFVCALAGIGCHVLLRAGADRALLRRRATVGTAAAALVLACLLLLYRALGSEAGRRDALVADVALGAIGVVLLGVAALAGYRRRLQVAAIATATVVLAVQIVGAGAFYWPTGRPADFYPSNGLIQAAQQHVGHDRALLRGTFMGSSGNAYGIRTATGHTFQPDAWQSYLEAVDPGAYTPPGRTPTNPRPAVELTGARDPLLDRLGARWVIVSEVGPVPGPAVGPDRTSLPAPGADRVDLAGGTGTAAVTAGPLRGVQFFVEQPVTSAVRLEARVVDERGQVLAVGTAARGRLDPGWFTVPIAGESLPTIGRVTVHLRAIGPEVPSAAAVPSAQAVPVAATGATPTVRLLVPAHDDLRLVYSDEHGALWERLSALPRIRWADGAVVEPDQDRRLAALSGGDLPDDTVVLDAAPPETDGRGLASAGSGASRPGLPGHGATGLGLVGPESTSSRSPAVLRIDQDTDGVVAVGVTTTDAGYLVVAEALTSGWVASVDGRRVDILAADQAFGAVPVPSGTHQVRFEQVGRYRWMGGAISLVAFVTAAAAWASVTLRPRPPGWLRGTGNRWSRVR